MTRVAVLGLPRGGTSVVVGLLRILGWQLPPVEPRCLYGESGVLRWADSPLNGDVPELLRLVDALPDGTVWKDPAVGLYADQVDWSGWEVIRVIRDPAKAVDSELRHGNPEPPGELLVRDREWAAALDRVPARLALTLGSVQSRPGGTLGALSETLLHQPATPSQGYRAGEFVRPGLGYRCPLQGSCEAPGPDAHQL